MEDMKKLEHAKRVYRALCELIEKQHYNYGMDESKLLLRFTVNGEDIPMQFTLAVDVERQLIRLMSPMPFKISQEKRFDCAIACCSVNYSLADGSFDYDLSDGTIVFRMTASFLGSSIGEGLLRYMITCAQVTVDKYNDKFLAIDNDSLSLAEFIKNC